MSRSPEVDAVRTEGPSVLAGLRRLYRDVAPTYERVNHVLTFGLDMHWRRQAASAAAAGGGSRWIDLCSGTGEMADALQRRAVPGVALVAIDLSRTMLRGARAKPRLAGAAVAQADGLRLPFAEGTFDLATIAFATRNLHQSESRLQAALREFCRILTPGGRLVNLETSQPPGHVLRRLFHVYVALAVRPVGRLLSGSSGGYRYLAHTIPRFHEPGAFAERLRDCGFARVDQRRLLGGVAAIHVAHKQETPHGSSRAVPAAVSAAPARAPAPGRG